MKDFVLTSTAFFNHTESGEAAFVSGRHGAGGDSNEVEAVLGALCFLFYFGDPCLVCVLKHLSFLPVVATSSSTQSQP